MIRDIFTIMGKEFKELLQLRFRLRGGIIGVLILVFAFGIMMPLQTGPAWVESAIGLVYYAWLPYLLVNSIVADTIAGERERHTLETLLASRLSDRAILFGKVGTALAYGWGLTLINILISLVTVNVAFQDQGLLLFPLDVMLSILGLSFLVALLGAGLGVNVSLRAATVRQAQQTTSIMMFVLIIPVFLLPLLPEEWMLAATQAMMNVDMNTVVMVVMGALIILDAALLAFGLSRFKRSRLILD